MEIKMPNHFGDKKNKKVIFDKVLLISDNKKIHIGQSNLDKARVVGSIVRNVRGPKIIVQKFNAKKRYKRIIGHREKSVLVNIDKIEIK